MMQDHQTVQSVALEAWLLQAGMGYSLTPKSSLPRSRQQGRVQVAGLHGPNEHTYGHDVVAGHGRTPPAIPRLSPRLATLAEEVLYGEAHDGRRLVRGISGDEKVDGVLTLLEVPPLVDYDSRSLAEMQNLKDGFRPGRPSFLHCYRSGSDYSLRDCLSLKGATLPPLSQMNPPRSRTTTSGPNSAPSSRN